MLEKRLRVLREVEKDMGVPFRDVDGVERVIFAVKFGGIHVRCAEQFAVEGVGPAVIGALNARCKFALRFAAHTRAAVAADVVEGLQSAGGVACDNNAFVGDFGEEIIAGVGDLFGATDAHPHLREEGVEFVAKDVRVGVIASRESVLWSGGHYFFPGEKCRRSAKGMQGR